ncbi:SMP-30/gluconolactonase/LRE family protein [Algibacter lectus]|uniref:SMP-30/gluconolactonase/LRE family protein n=1 Tax=Algibacter lectus TaxID=221126 RepID=UPI0026ED8D7A|nr:SMP-30/gluconolactonase/LRE family protein [Algibacter lectus]MDO7135990.1 SMP-30/gluconolactonase/LRE family protein [Algibacter lectus]
MAFKKLIINTVITTIIYQTSCFSFQIKDSTHSKQENNYPDNIIFEAPGQNPEGITFNAISNIFYLSAINQNPSIITVDIDGNTTTFSNDKEATSRSSFGLKADTKNNRLIACTNGPKIGNINIYNLNNGILEQVVNLASLLPKKEHYQINDLIVDSNNVIYITGRMEDAIYKIDTNLNASVFFQKDGYTKPNGIVYHPDGFLLVSYSHQNSTLLKIPINNPEAAETVLINNYGFKGFDGMLLNEVGRLIGVTFAPDANGNHAVIELKSDDNWKTANITNSKKIKQSTTITQVKPNIYYVINQDWKDRNAKKWTLEKVTFN